jgi:hypothetical protein
MAMPAAAPGPKYKAALSAEVVALKVSDIDAGYDQSHRA